MENPLCGTFNRERTQLAFSQRSLEVTATYLAMIGGSALFAVGLAKMFLGVENIPLYPGWFLVFGLSFFLAGLWAFLLFRSLKFDLRKRVYVERSGSGAAVRWRKGSIDEVRCLEVGAYSGLLPASRPQVGGQAWGGGPGAPVAAPGTVFTLRLWWHDPHRYPPVVEHLVAGVACGGVDHRVGRFVGMAQAYAAALKVPLIGSIDPNLAPRRP